MNTADTAVAVLWGGGVVLALVGFGTGATVACSDVGYHGDPPGGVEFIGIEHGDLLYTPDGGVNTCAIPATILLLPFGVLLITSGVGVLWQTSRTNQNT